MTDDKRRKHRDEQHEQHGRDEQEEQEEEHTHPTQTSKDLLEYDPEKARDLINLEEADRSHGDIDEPNRNNPQHKKGSITPGQENVPAGHTTGSGMQGGSANRRKR